MAQALPQSQWVKLRSWAAHNRVHDLLLVTCQYIYTEDVDDARVLLAGLDHAAETVNDVASLEGIIDTLAGFRPWFLRAVRPEDFFNLRLSIIRYMAVSELRRQLPPGALGEITEEDVSGIDLGPYWELLDRYFPRDIRKRKFKDIEKREKGREDDSAWQRAKRLLEYEVDRVESDRLMLVDVLSQKDKSTPDRTKILKLLDVYGDDSWVEKLKKITRQTEERLIRPPPDLFGEDTDSAVRAARGLDVGRVWDPEVLGMPNDDFRQLLKRHIPALFNEYTAGPAALEAAVGNADDNDVPAPPFPPTPAAPRTRGAMKKRAMDSGAKADKEKGKERVVLEEKASRLKRSVRAKGGDPIEDQPSMRDGQEEVKEKDEGRQPQRDEETEDGRQEKDGAGEDEQKEKEGSEPERQGRATRRSPAARAADQAPPAGVAIKSEPKANPKASGGSRLRYDDPRRQGLEISFNDSQYQGDEDDEDATENELEEDEDEIEDDESDDSRRGSGKRRRLATPSKARRYTLGPGGSNKMSKAARAGKGGGQRIRWTREEVEALERAVREGHLGQWAYIRDNYAEIQPFRTSVDIKDKWRNLQKARAMGPA